MTKKKRGFSKAYKQDTDTTTNNRTSTGATAAMSQKQPLQDPNGTAGMWLQSSQWLQLLFFSESRHLNVSPPQSRLIGPALWCVTLVSHLKKDPISQWALRGE